MSSTSILALCPVMWHRAVERSSHHLCAAVLHRESRSSITDTQSYLVFVPVGACWSNAGASFHLSQAWPSLGACLQSTSGQPPGRGAGGREQGSLLLLSLLHDAVQFCVKVLQYVCASACMHVCTYVCMHARSI